MIKLTLPVKFSDIKNLKAGDKVLLSGTIFTARDKAHMFITKKSFKKITGEAIYHCGPLVKGKKIISAGPTTSARMNPYIPELIKKYKTPLILGKGGLNKKAVSAMKGKAVYLSAVGGAGSLYASKIEVKNVFKKEFGMAEAIWEFSVKDFPAIVTIDSKGKNIYETIELRSRKILKSII